MNSRPRSNRSNARPLTPGAVRILTAVPICDGHDSAILTLNLEFARHGIEVIYLGYHRSVSEVARAAIQEDVQAVGLSSYNGGHIEFFSEVLQRLREQGARDIGLFGGGGGTINGADARQMHRRGVERIFFAGTPLAEMVEWVKQTYGNGMMTRGEFRTVKERASDRDLARLLTSLEMHSSKRESRSTSRVCPVVGITGP